MAGLARAFVMERCLVRHDGPADSNGRRLRARRRSQHESWREIRAGYGTAYGTAVFVVGDEIAITAAGLSNPLKKPIESHASAFIAHLIFGAVLEGVLQVRPKTE